jgi:uncharacterized protein (TIGR00304 family)
MDLAVLYTVGFALIVVGIVVVVVAMVLASRGGSNREAESQGDGEGEGKGKSETHAAGVIMIGPIPIIFGTDKKALKPVLILALALTIMALITFLVYYWLLR